MSTDDTTKELRRALGIAAIAVDDRYPDEFLGNLVRANWSAVAEQFAKAAAWDVAYDEVLADEAMSRGARLDHLLANARKSLGIEEEEEG